MTHLLLKRIFLLVALVGFSPLHAQVIFPDPSPSQTIRQNLGLSSVEISYSRPGVKGRTMIGNVEPYDSVWRTGANAPSKITFRSPVELKGNKVDSGTYVLYTIPRRGDWVVILNRGVKNWGSDNYRPSDDVCRFTVKPEKTGHFTETMAFQFENVKPETCDLVLSWEKWQIRLPIVVRVKEELRKQIESNLASANPIYWFAAQFYYEYDNNPQQALTMIDQAIQAGEKKGMKPYWYYHYKARILKELGQKEAAIQAALVSKQMAKEHGNRNNYLKLNDELIRSLK